MATQETAFPTNKLSVAVIIGPAVTEAWGAGMQTIYLPLSGPEMSMLMGALVTLLVGYFVPDRPNVASKK